MSRLVGMQLVRAGLVSLWESDARRHDVYAVAALIGLATYVVVYGSGHLVGTAPYWQLPQADERMALIGYRYFLYDDWHWPVFVSDAVNVPYPTSVAFLDCIPIWALANKAVATVVPPWKAVSATAYLGLWHGLAYALQPVLAVACLRALGHRSWRTGLATALVFVAVPTWIFRYAHPALSAHWILLWAFYLYLRTPVGPTPRALGIARVCQLGIAALVTPYHAMFSLLIYGPSVLRSRHVRTIAIGLPLGAVVVGLALWLACYFAGAPTGRQWGYEWNSANALSWLVPPRSGVLGDAQWIANVNPTPYQYDGYAYLGLGVLCLLALFVPHVRQLRAVIVRHPILFAVIVACVLLALSNRIYVGSHEIAHFRIPRFVRAFTDQFRSPGRFVWIPTYALVIFLLHWAFTRFASGWRFAIVALVVVLQVVDATGEWSWQRITTNGPQGTLLRRETWRPLVHAHRAVVILPPYSCVIDDRGLPLDHASMEIQLLASERALPINGTYGARPTRHCAEEERAWATLALAPETLYVVLPPALTVAERFEAAGAHCGAFELGRVCSTRAGAIAAARDAGILTPTR